MELSSTGSISSLDVQYLSRFSQTAELGGDLFIIWGDMHPTSLSFLSSHWNLGLHVSWASSGCQLRKLHSIYFKCKRTWLEESQAVQLNPASEIKPGSGTQLVCCAVPSWASLLCVTFSLSSFFPLWSLLCSPVLMTGYSHHYQILNLHAAVLPPGGHFTSFSDSPSLARPAQSLRKQPF